MLALASMERFAETRLALFAPTPLLTVTIEAENEQGPETHFHAGGQGVWVARMAAALGARVVLCAALAGEAGDVLSGLLRREDVEVRTVWAHGRSGSYVHDRRTGERVVVAETVGPRLWRHETDELYGVALAAGLEADLTMLTGPQPPDAVPRDVYERLAADLRHNGGRVIVDLTGEALQGALAGGIALLKISHEELIGEGLADGSTREQLLRGAIRLRHLGAGVVVVSRAADPALALVGERAYELVGPRFAGRDSTGAGDSMFAAIAVALGSGHEPLAAIKLGVAAGALNVTRRGLGTGRRRDVERIMSRVVARRLELDPGVLSAGGRGRLADDLE